PYVAVTPTSTDAVVGGPRSGERGAETRRAKHDYFVVIVEPAEVMTACSSTTAGPAPASRRPAAAVAPVRDVRVRIEGRRSTRRHSRGTTEVGGLRVPLRSAQCRALVRFRCTIWSTV